MVGRARVWLSAIGFAVIDLVVTIPPKMSIAKFVGQVKATASTRFNKLHRPEGSLFWQNEYGAFSFAQRQLANFVGYVLNQKAHHAEQTLIPVLEREQPPANHHSAETGSIYGIDDAAWRRQMTNMT